MPQYNFEHKWAHKNTDLSHVSLDILFTLYIRNVHHAGPNNIMSMSLGLKVGFKKTLYFNAGVLTGFCIITLLCAFFCAKLNDTHVGAGNALSHLACRKDFEKHLRHKSS